MLLIHNTKVPLYNYFLVSMSFISTSCCLHLQDFSKSLPSEVEAHNTNIPITETPAASMTRSYTFGRIDPSTLPIIVFDARNNEMVTDMNMTMLFQPFCGAEDMKRGSLIQSSRQIAKKGSSAPLNTEAKSIKTNRSTLTPTITTAILHIVKLIN